MRRLLLTTGIVALLAGLSFAPAIAGQAQDPDYPPTGTDIVLRDSDGTITSEFFAGENGTVSASGLLANETYDSKFEQSPGVVIGTGDSNGSGNLSDAFRIPTSANIGPATFCLDPRSTTEGDVCVAIRVVSASDAKGDVVLPATGSRIDQYIGLGAALVVIGTIIVALVRRRRGGNPSTPDRELAGV